MKYLGIIILLFSMYIARAQDTSDIVNDKDTEETLKKAKQAINDIDELIKKLPKRNPLFFDNIDGKSLKFFLYIVPKENSKASDLLLNDKFDASINGFHSNNSYLLSPYVIEGNNTFKFFLPQSIINDNNGKFLRLRIFGKNKDFKKVSRLYHQPIVENKLTYSFKVNFSKTPFRQPWEKCSEWNLKVPEKQKLKIKNIVNMYINSYKDKDIKTLKSFYKKYRKSYEQNIVKAHGYVKNYNYYDDKYFEFMDNLYMKKQKSLSRTNNISIFINPGNKKIVQVSPKAKDYIFKITSKAEDARGPIVKKVKYLNFIKVDDHWEMY